MALRARFTEEITVSSSAIGITSTNLEDSSGRTLSVHMATFQLASGGDIHTNPLNTPVAGDGDDNKRTVTNLWEVWGSDDLKNFQMVKQTGEDDAKVVVHGYGS